MPLDYNRHARRRMALRGITPEDVAYVVEHAVLVWIGTRGNPCYLGEVGGRWLRVVVLAGSEPPRVKTVMEVYEEEEDDDEA